ncbi:MAG: cellulose binding domain-containing protein [Planctomycetota bacterium]
MPNRRWLRRVRPHLEQLEDRAVPAVAVAYNVTQDWGSGAQGQVKLTNPDAAAVANWTVEFDFAASITSVWDGRIVSHVGNHYVVTNSGWNASIAPGGNASFGFVMGPANGAAPSGFKVNGSSGAELPTLSVADLRVGEGGTAAFTVSLSKPATEIVTVKYATVAGTATAGSDFGAASGTLTFAVGESSKTVAVSVPQDSLYEGDETFRFVLSSPTKASLARAEGVATIADDDSPPATGDFTFKVTSDWGSGFSGEVTAKNGTGKTLTNWTLEFDFAGPITSIWNASIKSHVGNHYVVSGANWNQTLAPGATASIGFNGSPGGAAAVVSNLYWGGTVDPVAETLPAGKETWPTQFYAPYVDTTLWPTPNFLQAAKSQGLRYFTLAFVVADSAGNPAWGGFSDYDVGKNSDFEAGLISQIAGVRNLGGDVMVSFGGASNRELAEVITDVTVLKNAYKKVVDAYKLTHIDFDIEGGASADRASVDRRSQAVALLQTEIRAAGKSLSVSLTLPVLPSGLTADGLYSVQSAKRFGVDLSGVNIMTMDYGDSAAPNPQGKMGDYAIQAAQSLKAQLAVVYGAVKSDAQLWNMIGVTPMIGMNDIQSEIFDQQEAREVLAFAKQVGIGRISIWSLSRDQQAPSGALNYVDLHSSSVLQSPLEFSLLFNSLTRS